MDSLWFSDLLHSIDWSTLANIAVVVSAFFVIRQLREMRYTTHAQAYSTTVDILQGAKIRKARKVIFQLKGKPIDQWTAEEIDSGEIVCYTYDVVGQMVKYRLLPKNIIIDSFI